MNDDLEQRIQEALDRGALAEDPSVGAALSEDPVAAAQAAALEQIDRALREWPEPEVDGAKLEALAARVEDRLEAELPVGPDPVLPPELDEEDPRPERADPSGAQVTPPPARRSGEYSLSNLTALEVDAQAPKPAPPPSPSGAVLPTRTGERFSLPMVKPTMQGITIDPLAMPSERPPAPEVRVRRRRWGWAAGGLAVAAAALLTVTLTRQKDAAPGNMEAEAPPPAAVASDQAAPVAAPAAPHTGGIGGPPLAGGDSTTAATSAGQGASKEPADAPDQGAAAPSPPAPTTPTAANAAAASPQVLDDLPQASRSGAPRHHAASEPSAGRAGHTAHHTSRDHAGGGGAATNAPLPDTPSRSDVMRALAAVGPAVAACSNGVHGIAQVHIVVSGPTGRVSSATVVRGFTGTPQGSCVARAVRRAHFPRFRHPNLTIDYPFRL